jgi:hypothetical protein
VEGSGEIEGKLITLCPNTFELRDDQNYIKDVGKTIKMALRPEIEHIPSSSRIKHITLSSFLSSEHLLIREFATKIFVLDR